MSREDKEPQLSEQTLELLKEFQQALDEEDHDRLVKEVAPALLFEDRLDPERDSEIVMTLFDLYVKSLLELGQYESVVQLLTTSSTTSKQQSKKDKTLWLAPKFVAQALEPARLYAMYRLERYPAVAQQATASMTDNNKAEDQLVLKHLQAQALYHLQDYRGASSLYDQLLNDLGRQDNNDDDDDDDKDSQSNMETIQLLNNRVALSCSHMVPFARSTDDLAEYRTLIAAILQKNANQDTHDLSYNVAMYDLCTAGYRKSTADTARSLLQDAVSSVQKTAEMEGWTKDELNKELALLEWNLEWSNFLWQGGIVTSGNTLSCQNLSKANRLVALANQALLSQNKPSDAVRLLPKPSDTLFTPLQNNLLYYNRAALYCRANNWSECQSTCQEWANCIQVEKRGTKSNNNKKQQDSTESSNGLKLILSPLESFFWGCRIAVFEAICLLHKEGGDPKAAAKRMDDQIALVKAKQNGTGTKDELFDHMVVFLMTHRALVEQPSPTLEQTMAILQSLPGHLQQYKAVVATLASLYHQQGKEEDAHRLLHQSGHEDALATFWLTQGRHPEVVELLQSKEDVVSRAQFIQALSYVDPSKAHAEWSRLEIDLCLGQDHDDDDVTAVDGAQLELKELPRLKHVHKSRNTALDTASPLPTNGTHKKSHESVLRRRARKREQYLAELERKGRPVTQNPDPERWLPKYERSYNRRRRNRQQQQQHKGAQGGISERDAQKLDVAARQKGSQEADGKSTAHIKAVSSGAPRSAKGGRRRN